MVNRKTIDSLIVDIFNFEQKIIDWSICEDTKNEDSIELLTFIFISIIFILYIFWALWWVAPIAHLIKYIYKLNEITFYK